MEKLIIALITSIIGSADVVINSVFNSLINVCFNAEEGLTHILGVQVLEFTLLKLVILAVAILLIMLLFLKKGFEMYILWTEGDTDTPISSYVINFARALVTAISFTFLYDLGIDIATDVANSVLISLNISAQQNIIELLILSASANLFTGIFALIILIMLFLLYIQFLMRGIEMFILEVGFPLACVGLINSDKGVFAPYIKKFIQSILTVIVQMALAKISILLIVSSQFIYATAIILVALRTPKFLQEFLLIVGNGSSGVSNAVHTTSKTLELSKQVKNLVGKIK